MMNDVDKHRHPQDKQDVIWISLKVTKTNVYTILTIARQQTLLILVNELL